MNPKLTSNGTILVNQLRVTGTLIINIDEKSVEPFKSLVQRAMNTWPDAPAELKEFADLLLEGKILQDYKSQG